MKNHISPAKKNGLSLKSV